MRDVIPEYLERKVVLLCVLFVFCIYSSPVNSPFPKIPFFFSDDTHPYLHVKVYTISPSPSDPYTVKSFLHLVRPLCLKVRLPSVMVKKSSLTPTPTFSSLPLSMSPNRDLMVSSFSVKLGILQIVFFFFFFV